jgi:hypothetical protein
VLLCALIAVLLVIVWWNFIVPAAPPAAGAPAPARVPTVAARAPTTVPGQVEPLHLALLTAEKPQPEGGDRDPFHFGERAAAAPSADDHPAVTAGPPLPPRPVGPPPPPPIALKFIGVVDTSDRRKIAVLSDGQNVFYGREGEIVEGRYRIEHISAESIEMAWADGSGRQVIRLSGS